MLLYLPSDTSSQNFTPSGANLVCRMGMPPPVAIIARLVMSEPRLRNTNLISLRSHDRLTYFISIVTFTYTLEPRLRNTNLISLRSHDRLTYFISIVTFTYTLSQAVADRGLHLQPGPEGKGSLILSSLVTLSGLGDGAISGPPATGCRHAGTY